MTGLFFVLVHCSDLFVIVVCSNTIARRLYTYTCLLSSLDVYMSGWKFLLDLYCSMHQKHSFNIKKKLQIV